MYEELVKALRGCVLSKPCDGCPYYDPNGPTEKCATMNIAAADAIDELSREIDIDNAAMTAMDAAMPRWIPVTEQLPEEIEGLNWHEDAFIRCTSVWCCDVNTGSIGVRNRLQGKKTGIAYFDTEWHWSNAWWERWEPTHWMPIVPLPEPPKEEM